MNVAVTASSQDLPRVQRVALSGHLLALTVGEDDCWLLHGSCVGGDKQLWEIARHRLGYRTHSFPGRPLTDPWRAVTVDDLMDPVPSTKTPEMTRNRRMVNEADVLLAAPSESKELRRSGEWATIRYARSRGVPVIIVYPDGTENMEFAGIFAPGSTRNISRS